MNNSGLHTVKARWRKVCAALPAFALIGAGIALTTQTSPAQAIKGIAASNDAPAIVVPDVALTMPARTRTSDGVLPVPPPGTAVPGVRAPWAAAKWADVTGTGAPRSPATGKPAPVLPGSIGAVGSLRMALDGAGIPVHALEAYRGAVSLIDAADPSCHIDWALLAAIGRVESDHARFGGNRLDSAGVAQPGIIGIPLDGYNGTARITDSDGGLLDRDSVFDRAVGPMQFIPGTWRVAGADADGDGVKNPQDMADAAAATAIYLCSGPGDLRQPGDLRAAIMRYNASASYTRTVIAIADGYRRGVIALPAPDVSFPSSARSTSPVAKATPAKPAPRLLASVKTSTAGQRPALTHRSRTAIAPTKATPRPTQVQRTSSKPVPAPPPAARPTPPKSTPAKRAPATPPPGGPAPAKPVPATPIPAPRPPAPTTPTTSTPAVPAPVEPTPCPTTPSTPATPTTATPTTSTPTTSTQAPAASPSAVDPCSSPCLASAAPPATPETPTPEPTPPCLTPTPDSSPTTPTTEPNCPVTPPGIENCAIVPPVPTPTTTA